MSNVTSFKIGNTSYPIKDSKSAQILSSAEETVLLSNGTYRGDAVLKGSTFVSTSGKLSQYSYTESLTGATLTTGSATPSSLAQGLSYNYYNNGVYYVLSGSYVDGYTLYSSTDGIAFTGAAVTGLPESSDILSCTNVGSTVIALLYSETEHTMIYVYSTDGGLTWTTPTLSFTANSIFSSESTFYAVASNYAGVYKSTDGVNWTALTGSLGSENTTSASNSLNGKILAYDVNSGTNKIVVIDDTSVTTSQFYQGASSYVWIRLAQVINDRFVVIYTEDNGSIYYTTSANGSTWSTASLIVSGNDLSISPIGLVGDCLAFFVSDGTTGTFYWTNTGTSWSTFTSASITYLDVYRTNLEQISASRFWFIDFDMYNFIDFTVNTTRTLTALSYTKSEVDTALASKQGTLTAGTGIDISSGVISTDALRNTATGTGSLTINGTAATGTSSINIGLSSSASGNNCLAVGRGSSTYSAHNCVALGASSSTQAVGGTAIGTSANTQNNYGVAIGTNASATEVGSIAIGGAAASASATTATGTQSIAIGYRAKATAASAVQLGTGTNATESSLQFRSYSLVDSSGNIPAARLSNIYEIVQTLPASPTAGKIYFVTGSTT